MEYKPLIRNNPTDENLTKDHSSWLASRLITGKGNDNFSFITPYNEGKTFTVSFEDLNSLPTGIVLCNANGESLHVPENPMGHNASIAWQGCWTLYDTWSVLGYSYSGYGIVVPMNTFNIGYKMRNGWSPSRVN